MSEAKFFPEMRGSRQLIAVLVVGLLVSGVGAFWLRGTSTPARATTVRAVTHLVPSTTTTSTTAPPQTAREVVPDQPIIPPKQGYAPEPIIQIGTIEIPKIGLVSPIYHGITLRNIDLGPSHWPGTAFPGENGNAVFAGHRVTHTHPFLHIDQLVNGDLVYFTVNGVRSTYMVTGHEVVTPQTLSITDQTSTPTATLFACHPPHSASYRYVVHLALVADQ